MSRIASLIGHRRPLDGADHTLSIYHHSLSRLSSAEPAQPYRSRRNHPPEFRRSLSRYPGAELEQPCRQVHVPADSYEGFFTDYGTDFTIIAPHKSYLCSTRSQESPDIYS